MMTPLTVKENGAMNEEKTESFFYTSPLGCLHITATDNALLSASFLNKEVKSSQPPCEILLKTKQQLDEYFNATRKHFELTFSPAGTSFQQKVWQQLLQIPYGQTITYLQLAKRLGNVKSIRAAASANGKNPLAIFIPCHRVIGAGGKLTGYAGGLHRKQWLLEHEAKINGTPILF